MIILNEICVVVVVVVVVGSVGDDYNYYYNDDDEMLIEADQDGNGLIDFDGIFFIFCYKI